MKKIFIADDDSAICDSLQYMLSDEGYEVMTSTSGSTIEKIKTYKPDLLLLDIWMSGEDGREICKKLKKSKLLNHIPVILISASRDIVQSAKESGAEDFLEKPFSVSDLMQKVSVWLTKKTGRKKIAVE